jgi:translocator protein
MKGLAVVKLMVSLVITLLSGFAGSLITTPSIPIWYASLAKPFFSPPNVVFGPVWTFLYILMGISLFIIWQKRYYRGFVFFGVQLLLNFCWSVLFFGMHMIPAAFADIILLLGVIILYAVVSWKVSRAASVLFFPYIAWVAFATILNGAFWYLN